jgi:class 3 adenylate cyclase/tetratricopeptide (TPR) repeat protein
MECPRCQHRTLPDAAFCDECGACLEAACQACGQANRVVARFCRRCGQTLAPSGRGQPPRFVSPEGHLPQHLVDRILTSRAALEGERKQVTVLFADMTGSLELLTDRDPEEARGILDPVLELMMEAVHRYEGVVNQVMGDGIMALFGAPIAHEDHALRACHAALTIQRSIEQYATDLRNRQGIDVQVRVGLNSGDVVVRSIHSDLHMDYSAIGETTHLASRMEQLARPGTILITGSTLRAVDGLVDVKPLGDVPIKGLQAPVSTYELFAARHATARFQTQTPGRLSQFVGRATELAALQEALVRTRSGHGQIVALVGEPGVGKSRLAYEFIHSSSTHGWMKLLTYSISYGKQTAYLPVTALLKGYFHLAASDTVEQVRGKVHAGLAGLDEADTAPAILWLLDIQPTDDDRWNALDARVRRQRTIDALRRLLLRQSQAEPLLVVFEDLQWIDVETEGVLDALVEMLPTARIMLIVTYRIEYEHRWTSRTHYAQIRVDPLSPAAAEGFLQVLLGSDPSLGPAKRLLLERGEGNPFFLEESVQSLVDRGALVGERGAYRLAAGSVSIEIPVSVQAVLSARIDRLMPPEKRLLQAAAVIGKDVSSALLVAVVGDSVEAIDQSLRKLQVAEFLYETSISPREYTFKHALTHEVAYAGLLQEQRKTLHAAALGALERLYAERLAEHVEALARHAVRGEIWEKAVDYLRKAGIAAATRSAYRDAVRWHRSAIAGLEHLSHNPDRLALEIDLRFELYTALLAQGDHAPIFELLSRAESLAVSIGDEKRLARTHGYLSMAHWWRADYVRALDTGHRALAAARALQHRPLEAVALVGLGWTYHAIGQFGTARDLLTQVMDLANADPHRLAVHRGSPSLQVMALCWLASCHGEQGEFAQGLHYAQEGVGLAEAADHPWSRAAAYHALGALLTRQGAVAAAIQPLERGLRLCETFDIPGWGTTLLWALGYAYSLRGDTDHGVPLLEQAIKQAAADQSLVHQSVRMAWLSEAELLSGRAAHATELGREALGLAQQHGEHAAEGHILRILGDIAASDATACESALDFYEQALIIAKQLSMRPLQAQCHHAIGCLLGGELGSERGSAELRAAATLFDVMHMSLPAVNSRPWRNVPSP